MYLKIFNKAFVNHIVLKMLYSGSPMIHGMQILAIALFCCYWTIALLLTLDYVFFQIGSSSGWVYLELPGTVFFSSYLSHAKLSVTVGEFILLSALLMCGVPPGSILCPILFSLYMHRVGHIICNFRRISRHSLANTTHLYLSFKPNDFN